MNTEFITKNISVPNSWKTWFKALAAAVIGGAANSAGSALGIAGANQVGVTMPQLTPKQFGMLCLSGAVIGVIGYLKKSPLPDVNNSGNDNSTNP